MNGSNTNASENFNYLHLLQIENHLLVKTTEINLIITFIVLIVGLIGNFLLVYIFCQKRFRVNSSNVYLLCLGINDGLFLLIHFFENTIRTYQSYSNSYLIKMLNITDRLNLTCCLINYLRYTLRFISAFIIVAFTVQRLIIVSSPLQNRFRSKQSAWVSIGTILIVSVLVNFWVVFIFELQTENEIVFYCDIKSDWKEEYFRITIVYIVLIMIIPILIIFVCNILTIFKSFKSDIQRKKLSVVNKTMNSRGNLTVRKSIPTSNDKRMMSEIKYLVKHHNLRPFYMNSSHLARHTASKLNNTQKITKMLMLISFSYVVFNLPYLIIWFIYFPRTNFDDLLNKSYLLALTRCAETLQILNYGIHFYIYCISGSVFRQQFKYLSKNFC